MATAMRTAKKQQVEIGKTTTLHMHHAFLYIIFFAITAGLQSENSYFFSHLTEDVTTRQWFSFSFCELNLIQSFRVQLLKKSSTFDKIKRVGIIRAMKFETGGIRFLGDVISAIAIVA